jgi:hypothetical protein
VRQPTIVTHRIRRLLAAGAVGGVLVLALASPAGAAKINPAPVTNTVAEGASYDVAFLLMQPIIAPVGVGTVVVTFTVGDPSRVALSVPSVQWAATDWFQSRTVTVTALADGVFNATSDVVVSGATTSNSLFYDGFATAFTVSIVDADPPPPPPTAPPPDANAPGADPVASVAGESGADPSVSSLPRTGRPATSLLVVGVGLVAVGAALSRADRDRHTARGVGGHAAHVTVRPEMFGQPPVR